MAYAHPETDPSDTRAAPAGERPIVLVGLMGAGKTSVGKRLAQRLGLPFRDADAEIEAAAACTIEEIFERHGEPAFRDLERRVILRLLESGPCVLATGGGAFMDAETRANVARLGVSVWLRAELDVLVKRVKRRNNRPLLKKGDPQQILGDLMTVRHPVYATADVIVESLDGPHEASVEAVVAGLRAKGVLPGDLR